VRLGRIVVAFVALVAVSGLVAGIVTGFFGYVARQGLYATGLWHDGGASTVPPGTFETPITQTPAPSPGMSSSSPGDLAPVLRAATAGPKPNAAQVAKAVAAVSRAGVKGSFSGAVADVGTGALLYRHRASIGYIPASTTKLLTSTAALSVLGPDRRFVTRVVTGGGDRVVLVGGGDPYLAKDPRPGRASIAQLASAAASALKNSGRRTVNVRYDASLFSGPSWNPRWPGLYADQVTKISPLWVDEGRVNGGSPGPRVANAPLAAGKAFAAALRRHGVKVTSVVAGRAPAGAAELAAVRSMPLERIIETLLMASDNDAAEVVFRQTGLAGKHSGSFDGGRRAVQAALTSLGVWDAAVRVYDGSGLTRQTKVPAAALVRLLRLAVEEQHPELRAVATGLPVAGVEGSLRVRFFDDRSLAGRGVVRAKTGTLSKVHSLAGYVRTSDGSLLTYAFLVNNAKNDFSAVVWLDRVATALSRCGCRR
jgi:D-alanyl-D-alanine carboxypeptidase/D-alanyl-D-alanine-endopeptidase (penicillin-binding protein 4)